MLQKTWLLVTFYTTAGVMAMERACKAASLPGRIVPVPRSITADCGLAWRCEPTLQGPVEPWRTRRRSWASMSWKYRNRNTAPKAALWGGIPVSNMSRKPDSSDFIRGAARGPGSPGRRLKEIVSCLLMSDLSDLSGELGSFLCRDGPACRPLAPGQPRRR